MANKNRYNIGDRVRAKIHYSNDSRTVEEAVIRGIELEDESDNIRYKIHFEPDEYHKKQGSTRCVGYINQDDIIVEGIDSIWIFEIQDGICGGFIIANSEEEAMKKLSLDRGAEMSDITVIYPLAALDLNKDVHDLW